MFHKWICKTNPEYITYVLKIELPYKLRRFSYAEYGTTDEKEFTLNIKLLLIKKLIIYEIKNSYELYITQPIRFKIVEPIKYSIKSGKEFIAYCKLFRKDETEEDKLYHDIGGIAYEKYKELIKKHWKKKNDDGSLTFLYSQYEIRDELKKEIMGISLFTHEEQKKTT